MHFPVDLIKERRGRFLSSPKKVYSVFNGNEILMLPNSPTRTMRENRKMKWVVFRCSHCGDFTLQSSFLFYCMLHSKNKNQAGRPPYIILPMFLWQEPRAFAVATIGALARILQGQELSLTTGPNLNPCSLHENPKGQG